MGKKLNLTGQRFGRLVVKSKKKHSKTGRILWKCNCDCGGTALVRGDVLKSGFSRSCGCLQRERQLAAITKHGKSETSIYHVWEGMKARCYNKNAPNYERYGARGITVCDRWLDFEKFYDDMGEKPEGLTIDRINNNGNYEPGNCRWATNIEQQGNTRKSRLLNYKGKTRCLAEWSRKLQIPKSTLFNRLKKQSLDVAFGKVI